MTRAIYIIFFRFNFDFPGGHPRTGPEGDPRPLHRCESPGRLEEGLAAGAGRVFFALQLQARREQVPQLFESLPSNRRRQGHGYALSRGIAGNVQCRAGQGSRRDRCIVYYFDFASYASLIAAPYRHWGVGPADALYAAVPRPLVSCFASCLLPGVWCVRSLMLPAVW